MPANEHDHAYWNAVIEDAEVQARRLLQAEALSKLVPENCTSDVDKNDRILAVNAYCFMKMTVGMFVQHEFRNKPPFNKTAGIAAKLEKKLHDTIYDFVQGIKEGN